MKTDKFRSALLEVNKEWKF